MRRIVKIDEKLISYKRLKFLGLLLDVALVAIIYSIFYSINFFRSQINVLVEQISRPEFIQIFNNLLGGHEVTIIFVFIVLLIWRFYWNLILGVSLGQWLMGLRPTYRGSWPKIGGAARCLFELIFSLTIVLELISFKGKRPIKEIITGTYINYKEQKLWFSCLLFLFITCIGLISPLLEDIAMISGVEVVQLSKQNSKLKKNTDFSSLEPFDSNFFRFSILSNMAEKRYVVIPSFEIIKIKGKKRIYPFFYVYDRKLKIAGQVHYKEKMNIFKIISIASEGDYLFSNNYPLLSKLLKSDKEQYRRKNLDENHDAVLDNETRQELKVLFNRTWSLSFKNSFEHILELGPFIRGSVRLRKYLNEKLNVINNLNVYSVNLNNNYFLLFEKKSEQISDSVKKIEQVLFPLYTTNLFLLESTWPATAEGSESLLTFQQNFTFRAKWYFDSINIFPFPQEFKSLSPFHILDFFTKKGLSQRQRSLMEGYLIKRLAILGRVSLLKKENILKDIILQTVKRIKLVALLRNSTHTNYYSESFLNRIMDIQEGLNTLDLIEIDRLAGMEVK